MFNVIWNVTKLTIKKYIVICPQRTIIIYYFTFFSLSSSMNHQNNKHVPRRGRQKKNIFHFIKVLLFFRHRNLLLCLAFLSHSLELLKKASVYFRGKTKKKKMFIVSSLFALEILLSLLPWAFLPPLISSLYLIAKTNNTEKILKFFNWRQI